jgi:hypothetical protein
VAGTSDVTFNASDPGSGVYQAVFTLDGQIVQTTLLNENGGRCRNVGQTSDGLPAFLYIQPCQASLSADVGFDTTRFSNGSHHLVVSVTDAAGNSAPVLDRNITFANPQAPNLAGAPSNGANGSPTATGSSSPLASPGPPNGTPASSQATLIARWSGSRGARMITAYGRAQTITGRLTAPGATPIAGALIDVLAAPSYAGAATKVLASPRTAQDGRFTVHLPRSAASQTLRLSYRAHLGDPLPVASSMLTLTVTAGVALTITPRTASVGRRIYFKGRLLGGPIPRYGKPLVLEARSRGGAWIEFDVIRADSHGRFHATYRFKFPGPASYQFRVLSERESDYPFATGLSRVVGVSER